LELQHDSSSLKGNVYFAIKGKNPQNSLRLFFCLFFALVGKMDNTSFTCEYVAVYFAQMLKIFVRIMASFSAFSAVSPCHMLMHSVTKYGLKRDAESQVFLYNA